MPNLPLRALITGFGPFPGIRENASAAVAGHAARLADHPRLGLQAVAAVLPTEWDGAPQQLGRLLAEVQPHLCLHIGVSASARGVVVETHARNAAGERRDAAGHLPRTRRLLAHAPDLLLPRLNPLRLAARLASAGVPAASAPEAGDYVCNAVYFHSLWAARHCAATGQGPARQVAFLHLPVRIGTAGWADEERGGEPLPMEMAASAVVRVLQAMAELVRPESAALVAGLSP